MEPLIQDPYLVPIIFHWAITILCIILYFRYSTSEGCTRLLQQNPLMPTLMMCVAFTLLLGARVASGVVFGDSSTYKTYYEIFVSGHFSDIKWDSEWFFAIIQTWCKSMEMNYVEYFLTVEIGYIGFIFLAVKKLLWEDVWFAMLFMFSAFSFMGYGVNGLRNGLACSMALAAMAFMANGKVKNLPIGIGLFILAFGTHKSTILPIGVFFIALYLVKNVRWALWFWIASIGISLVAGETIQNIFIGLGFDERADRYLTNKEDLQYFSHTGFRWDFLLYSAMPVLLSWYAVVKKGVQDKVFNVLACTYILSNSFWVMICRTSFSNRFAYLSWFMYPLVIAYAVIRLPIWEDQDRKAGQILLAHAGFSLFMWLIGK